MLKMLAVGDVFLPRDVAPGAFAHTADLIRAADVSYFNLECIASDLGEGVPGRSFGVLRIPPKNLHSIIKAGFNLASLAHNHALDFGVEAMLDTKRQVAALGLVHAGSGQDLKEASTPGVLEVKGQSVAYLAYSSVFLPGYQADKGKPGIAAMNAKTYYEPVPPMLHEFPGYPPTVVTKVVPADLERLQGDIKSAASTADIVLVSFHFGIPGSAVVLDYQKELGHAAIDAGALAVLGSHAHVMQGIELYRGRPIFYSLGNFVFELPDVWKDLPYSNPYLPRETMLARWTFKDGVVSDLEVVPMWIDDLGHPHPADGDRFRAIQAQLQDLCTPFGTSLTAGNGFFKVGPAQTASVAGSTTAGASAPAHRVFNPPVKDAATAEVAGA
ncbi:MAG TPA: CapA family protein [Burkholderiaceae bacterium]|nr:CapA family protein [Burkholderiaceae bacterium]HQR70721.1 CapA family protein [Burkholderiaceae bacterium]